MAGAIDRFMEDWVYRNRPLQQYLEQEWRDGHIESIGRAVAPLLEQHEVKRLERLALDFSAHR